ncbi:NADP-dependent 3-hydroxy acid dehydrogenase YdfG [Roseivivax halotolerans]|jgi:NADP-dependent 3-hydroxy acid dehydrogenase YdfG|uniref:NADP-dependent 3-hydroxy acid dehydrogenase YdfG n=1 Tax=Roseivivax halotolerans TaxID=93684 RepID=A0A1I5VYC8_9RHOB|nr:MULTISPECIES: SDR family oxidoreductase [Roseivivax]QFT63973.1 putative oxidoreductase [Roseivivax sp. THAF30]SFQ12461.1 NADP-dependent 3-hydroxy acid dehydrogenase YdfG [Roseivivax halotolerans]
MAGKTIFITGASSGIGAESARAAVQAGWNVGLFARSEDKIAELASELGDKAMALPGDVTDMSSQVEALDKLADQFGSVDAAFANAGTGLSAAGTEAGDPEEWEKLVQINILGLLWTTKAAMPHLKKSKGQLLLTGSAAGRRHIKGSVYGASKWFVHGYGGNLAEEMREFGGRCTVIAPGMVDTPFFDSPKPDKLHPEDIARSVVFALEADPRANVQEVFVMPVN